MENTTEYFSLRIPRKPWYVWAMWCVWGLWFLLWCEIAIGSWQEQEIQACVIAAIVSILSLGVAAGIVWKRSRRVISSEMKPSDANAGPEHRADV